MGTEEVYDGLIEVRGTEMSGRHLLGQVVIRVYGHSMCTNGMETHTTELLRYVPRKIVKKFEH
jgi:hypothetical protein